MKDGEARPFPPAVQNRIRQYQEQIIALTGLRDRYLQGVLDALGVQGPIRVDFEAMSYQPAGPAEVPGPAEGASA